MLTSTLFTSPAVSLMSREGAGQGGAGRWRVSLFGVMDEKKKASPRRSLYTNEKRLLNRVIEMTVPLSQVGKSFPFTTGTDGVQGGGWVACHRRKPVKRHGGHYRASPVTPVIQGDGGLSITWRCFLYVFYTVVF